MASWLNLTTPSEAEATTRYHQYSCTMSSSKTFTSDQPLKRLIKTRDAGARSRARQQAYQNHLETKLALLMEENSTLTTQLQELQMRLKSSAAPPKLCTLDRTSTSPF